MDDAHGPGLAAVLQHHLAVRGPGRVHHVLHLERGDHVGVPAVPVLRDLRRVHGLEPGGHHDRTDGDLFDGVLHLVVYRLGLADRLAHLAHVRLEVDAGRSTQATLLGRDDVTYESVYLSNNLVEKLHIAPTEVIANHVIRQPALFEF